MIPVELIKLKKFPKRYWYQIYRMNFIKAPFLIFPKMVLVLLGHLVLIIRKALGASQSKYNKYTGLNLHDTIAL